MIFIEHANFNRSTIKSHFGAPEYSYLFVKNGFQPVVDRLGQRVDVSDPEREVDPIFHAAKAKGEDCVFLSYNPPQKTVLGLACPTLPIIAWEYDTIPSETWDDNPRHNWCHVLSQTGMAVTLSRASADAVKHGLGDRFPVWAIPTPVFDTYSKGRSQAQGWREPFDLSIKGGLAIDAGRIDLSPFRPECPTAKGIHMLRVLVRAAEESRTPPQTVSLHGVIYTAVLSPADGRKNWRDLVSGFIWAFRRNPNATLLFKLTHATVEDGLMPVLRHLSMVGEFECRVILINGLLAREAYEALIDATSYTVNTALAEGQCLPLVEYMSAGRPAVAPSHSAMLDYVSTNNSFVVASGQRLASWPQDDRAALRCHNNLVSFADLVKQYHDSYHVARYEPQRYARMSEAAVTSTRDYCSEEVVTTRLRAVLDSVRQQQSKSLQGQLG